MLHFTPLQKWHVQTVFKLLWTKMLIYRNFQMWVWIEAKNVGTWVGALFLLLCTTVYRDQHNCSVTFSESSWPNKMIQKIQEGRQEPASNCEHTYQQKQKYSTPPRAPHFWPRSTLTSGSTTVLIFLFPNVFCAIFNVSFLSVSNGTKNLTVLDYLISLWHLGCSLRSTPYTQTM